VKPGGNPLSSPRLPKKLKNSTEDKARGAVLGKNGKKNAVARKKTGKKALRDAMIRNFSKRE